VLTVSVDTSITKIVISTFPTQYIMMQKLIAIYFHMYPRFGIKFTLLKLASRKCELVQKNKIARCIYKNNKIFGIACELRLNAYRL